MPKIEHVVFLMMENRSFDHMLGFLPLVGLEGLIGPNEGKFRDGGIPPTPNASFSMKKGPSHSHKSTMEQIGSVSGGTGYVANYKKKDEDNSGLVMQCFSECNLPVLSTLAKEYAVCDHWFSSLPGGTLPNRDFAHAGSSFGYGQNPKGDFWHMYATSRRYRRYRKVHKRQKRKNIFHQLRDNDKSYRVYYKDISCLKVWPQLSGRHSEGMLIEMTGEDNRLIQDIKLGNLPTYTFVDPDYGLIGKGNSQHPGQAADSAKEFTAGEKLIASIYNTLKDNTELFEKTLFVISYDEHGGFYDHVRPPAVADGTSDGALAKQPDHHVFKDGSYRFDFTQFGPRVPTVIVSPWIKRGTIDSRVYDHTSMIATLRKLFAPGAPAFGHRDGAAQTFEGVASLAAPRRGADLPTVEALNIDSCASADPVDPVDTEDDEEEGNLPNDLLGLLHAIELDDEDDEDGELEIEFCDLKNPEAREAFVREMASRSSALESHLIELRDHRGNTTMQPDRAVMQSVVSALYAANSPDSKVRISDTAGRVLFVSRSHGLELKEAGVEGVWKGEAIDTERAIESLQAFVGSDLQSLRSGLTELK